MRLVFECAGFAFTSARICQRDTPPTWCFDLEFPVEPLATAASRAQWL